jgi:cell division protein FtsB
MKTNFDFKTWVIIILGIALCISFWFGQRNKIDDNKDVIDALHANNETLTKRNDSLKIVNTKLDAVIADINTQLVANEVKLASTQSDLDKLKKQKNETTIRVNGLSANGVSNAFSDYLKDRTKSTNKR